MPYRLWRALRRAFPLALAVVLMPNHLHLVEVVLGALEAREVLRHAIAAAMRDLGCGCWEEVPEVEELPDTQRVLRAVRYALNNPCRAFLTADPLRWAWSTFRDVHLAVADPWVTPGRLASLLDADEPGFASWFHQYVTEDSHVHPGARVMPAGPVRREQPVRGLLEIERAVLLASRRRPGALRRRDGCRPLFIGLAEQQGWRATATIADRLGVTPDGVRRARRSSAVDIAAAARCLEDPRLLWPMRPDDPRVRAYLANPKAYLTRARKVRRVARWALTGEGNVARDLA
jgi:hypothetical protein